MAEIDHSALEAVQEDMDHIHDLTTKAELELANKRNELMAPIYKKRQEVIAKIPNFWYTLFRMHPLTANFIEERDLPILEHLTDVFVKHDDKDSRNYEIIFTFKENPYFSNKELIKKVVVKDDDEETSIGEVFEINWKEGQDVTKSQKRKKDDDDEGSSSFFAWFKEEDTSIADIFALEIFPQALRYVEKDPPT
ncbi:hypothetical protein BCR41DRAFT_363632, partial [Lobosporangium transversale]